MSSPPDLFEALAEREVPPVPEHFERRVHERLNGRLVLLHAVEFALWVLPYCAIHFGRALGGWLFLTWTGRHDVDRTPRSDDRSPGE